MGNHATDWNESFRWFLHTMNASQYRILVYKTVALYAVWLVLSQSSSPFHLGFGLLASFAVARLNSAHKQPFAGKMRWMQTITYTPWLLWKVLQSGIHLSYLVLHPRLPIDPKWIRYQTELKQPLGIVMLGNSITLTPGTITAEVDAQELVVHAIDGPSGNDLASLERQIAGVFRGTP